MLTLLRDQAIVRIFFFLLTALCLCSCSKPDKAPQLAEPLLWVNHDNPPIRSDQKPTVLVFLTNNCSACEIFAPIMNQFAKDHANTLNVIAIFTPNNAAYASDKVARKYVTKNLKLTIPTIFDKQTRNFYNYQINVWPTLVLINRKGQMAYHVYGAVNKQYLDKLVVLHLDRVKTS